jgi:hypothetical protein
MVLKHRIKKIPMDEEQLRLIQEAVAKLSDAVNITTPGLKKFSDAAKQGSDTFKKELDKINKEIKILAIVTLFVAFSFTGLFGLAFVAGCLIGDIVSDTIFN